MHSRISFAIALATALLLVPAGMAAAERLSKVDVCHVPPGNPGNAHTINVSGNSLPAHLRHGDFGVGEVCSEGLGECRAEGITQCDVSDTCSAVPGEPTDEVCDGLDNDCDGVVDNDPVDLGECTAGVGECAVDGISVCTEDGSIACDAVPDAPPEAREISCGDGRDNDCDGLIDVQDPDCSDGNRLVGTITADITRGGTPPGSDRGVESAAGNLVADAQLWATSANGAQVAFMNPGGVRSDLTYLQSQTPPEGDGVVTFNEAFTFQPFGNTLITYPMTGAQILSVLQEQCQPAGSSRPFLHLGVSTGFTYDLAKTIVAGDCTSVAVSNAVLNGAALDPAATYMVTVNGFLADGGDNFATFGTIVAPRLDGGNDLQALVNYLGTFSPVAPPSTDRVNELP